MVTLNFAVILSLKVDKSNKKSRENNLTEDIKLFFIAKIERIKVQINENLVSIGVAEHF
jgi:hypothetical protein